MSPLTSADDSSPEVHEDQTEIAVGDPDPTDPCTFMCEWCKLPAVDSLEIQHKLGRGTVRTGTFVYFCAAHRGTAEAVIADRATRK